MNCETANELIMKYFDLEINDIEDVQLKQHMESCRTCREEFLCMKNAFAALEAADGFEPPEDFEVKVMEKIDAIENAQMARRSRMLVLLYNLTSIASIVLILFFATDIRHADIAGIANSLWEFSSSVISAASAVLSVVKDLFGLVGTIISSLFSVCYSVVKAYYYVWIAMLVVLTAIQALFVVYTAQEGRNAA